jgi:hypothetical protein
MVDWMVQVFRVMKRSTDKTFFQAVSILDRFFKARSEAEEPVTKGDLHIFGLVSIFLASKIEDVIPIFMTGILESAGHGKFKKHQVIEAEETMIKALEFKLMGATLFDTTLTEFKVFLLQNQDYFLSTKQISDISELIIFVGKASLHSMAYCTLPIEELTQVVISVALLLQIQMTQSPVSTSWSRSKSSKQSFSSTAKNA